MKNAELGNKSILSDLLDPNQDKVSLVLVGNCKQIKINNLNLRILHIVSITDNLNLCNGLIGHLKFIHNSMIMKYNLLN